MAEQISETVKIAQDLIRFDTSNRGGGDSNPEEPAAIYVADYMKTLGLEPVFVESAPGRVSVFARVKGENPDLPALVLHGHLDVVPADASEWSVDPFAGIIKDGLLWGRGAVDMKNMNAMILTAMAEIIRSDQKPKRDIILGFFADEEDGGAYGSRYVVDNHPEIFAGASTAISEVGGYSVYFGSERAYVIQTGEKALDWINLKAKGRAQHGSSIPEDNPIVKLGQAVSALGQHEWPVTLCSTTTELLKRIAELTGEHDLDPRALMALAGNGSGFLQSSITTTANPTLLSAGLKHNVIPGSANASVDIRSLPSERDSVLETVQRLIGPDIEIESFHSDIGLEVPFEGELVETMIASLHQEDPDAHVLPYLLSGGTDNKALSRLGIAGFGFAPLKLPPELDFPGMFHGVDERVPLDALDFGHRVLVHLIKNY
ncbi:MAG TPA: M20/M25/M40 family metallo-hydrolase [Microbacteriaceae bacterium]|nr:M20/M25/M40 family metallo-hydrolase [Microbacteriaceae bacterium]